VKKMNLYLYSIMLISILCVSSCQKDSKVSNSIEDSNNNDVTIYLANSEMNGLIPIVIQLKENKMEEQINDILQALREDKNLDNARALLPEDVQIKKVKIQDQNVVITFNQAYTEMSAVEEILVRSSIVKSVTKLDGVQTVEFYIDGVPLKSATGVVVGPMGEDNIIVNSDSTLLESNNKEVTLYFSSKDGNYLVPVQVKLDLTENEQIETAIIKMLSEGPEDESLAGTIPKNTKILNVFVTDKVCYVNLSEEFINNHIGGTKGELITIYSIVNSLTELPNINKVQFLIEGEVQEKFKSFTEFNILFERNLDIVQK